MNTLSNRAYAWMIGGLLAAMATFAVLMSIAQQLQAASQWIAYALAALAILAVLALLYLAWHQLHTRHLDRKRTRTEIKLLQAQYEDQKWRDDKEILHRHELEREELSQRYELEREKLRTQQMRLHLDRERLHMIESQRVLVPQGHTIVFPQDDYRAIQAANSRELIAGPAQQQGDQENGIPVAPAFRDMSNLITPERLVLCYTSNGPAYGTVDDLLSMAITGKPGRGKTTALMYYVCMLLRNGAEVFIWDPHGAMNEISVLNGRRLPHMPSTARVVYLDRKDDIVASVPTLQAELAERDELYRKGKQVKHPLLILADELPVLADYDEQVATECKLINKQRAKGGDDPEPVPSMITVIRRFVLEARKWRCFFIGSGQTMDAEILPTRVTQSLNSRIVFFSSDMRARMAGLENDAIKNLLPLIRRAGPGVMVFDCSRWDSPVIGAMPAISTDDMLAYLGIATIADRPTITLDDMPKPERNTGPLVGNHAGVYGMPDLEPRHAGYQGGSQSRYEASTEGENTPDEIEAVHPINAQNSLSERVGDAPEFIPGPDDPVLDDLQIKLFTTLYEQLGNIEKSLAAIRNERGQGLGKRYAKHASWLVKTRGLKKRGN